MVAEFKGKRNRKDWTDRRPRVSHKHMTKRNQNGFVSLIVWKNDFQTANRDLR